MSQISARLCNALFGVGLLLAISLHTFTLLGVATDQGYLQDDSTGYLNLAHNWLTHSSYSQFIQYPHIPDVQRTPGYPVFLLLFGGNLLAIALVQHLLVAFIAGCIVWVTARAIPLQQARWAGLAFALMPYPALFANFILTETLCMALLVAGAVLYGLALRQRGGWALWAATLVAVAAVYVKVIVLPVWLLALVLWPWLVPLRRVRAVLQAAAVGALTVALLAPWPLRNHAIMGQYTFSTLGQTALVYGRLGGILALEHDQPTDDATLFRLADSVLQLHFPGQALHAYVDSAVRTQETQYFQVPVGRVVWGEILSRPGLAAGLQLRSIGQMLAGVGYGTALYQLHSLAAALALALWQGLLLVALYLGVGLWGWQQLRFRRWPLAYTLLFLATCLFLLAHAAIWADGRYRLICDPFWTVLAALGYAGLAVEGQSGKTSSIQPPPTTSSPS